MTNESRGGVSPPEGGERVGNGQRIERIKRMICRDRPLGLSWTGLKTCPYDAGMKADSRRGGVYLRPGC
jgi:hypothetical protein